MNKKELRDFYEKGFTTSDGEAYINKDIKLLTIYTPTKELPESFLELASGHLPPGARIQLIKNKEPSINTVGWDFPTPFVKLYVTHALYNALESKY